MMVVRVKNLISTHNQGCIKFQSAVRSYLLQGGAGDGPRRSLMQLSFAAARMCTCYLATWRCMAYRCLHACRECSREPADPFRRAMMLIIMSPSLSDHERARGRGTNASVPDKCTGEKLRINPGDLRRCAESCSQIAKITTLRLVRHSLLCATSKADQKVVLWGRRVARNAVFPV